MDEDEPDGEPVLFSEIECPSCSRLGGLRASTGDSAYLQADTAEVVCDFCGGTFTDDPDGEGGAEVVIEEEPEGPGAVACPECGSLTDDSDAGITVGGIVRTCPGCGATFAAGSEVALEIPNPGEPEDDEDDDEGEEADAE